VVPRDSVEITQAHPHIPPPDDVRAMSPRRNNEEVEALGKEARDELHK
jgi:short coiled-coil protein